MRLNIVLHSTGASAVKDVSGNALDGEWTNGASVYPSGNGIAGGDFDFAFNVLPGDANGDGIVNGQDLALSSSGWLNAGPTGDINADGIINGQDIAVISSAWLQTVPVGPIVVFTPSSSGGAVATLFAVGQSAPIDSSSVMPAVLPAQTSLVQTLALQPTATAPIEASSVAAASITGAASLAAAPTASTLTSGVFAMPNATVSSKLPIERIASFISNAAANGSEIIDRLQSALRRQVGARARSDQPSCDPSSTRSIHLSKVRAFRSM